MAHITRYVIIEKDSTTQAYVGHPQSNITNAKLELERLVREGYERSTLRIVEIPA